MLIELGSTSTVETDQPGLSTCPSALSDDVHYASKATETISPVESPPRTSIPVSTEGI
jgi:hypothetical protein